MEEVQQGCWRKSNRGPFEIVGTNGWVSCPCCVVHEVANKLISCDE